MRVNLTPYVCSAPEFFLKKNDMQKIKINFLISGVWLDKAEIGGFSVDNKYRPDFNKISISYKKACVVYYKLFLQFKWKFDALITKNK